ncbi:hypothetical protein E3N88_29068 [Mikania micrantha]|uniref:Transposase-associated domain-containing protein n=1 Tax=Mikania micrantha TaxID=192012 RepID=A0A5N6N2G3_9ASTR|nr:hypothetical protein E3N88_29068 [Mikania micrantha]
MTIDKSWITLGNRNSTAFKEGLLNFIEIAKNHVDSKGKTFSPCRRYVNSIRHDLNTVYAHIHSRGFLQSYQTWNYHGERYANADKVEALFDSRTHENDTRSLEMFDVIDDVMVEHNANEENTHEDESGLDPEFDALFKELKTELYPGCSWMSSLNFIAKLMHIKVINKWTDSSFDQLLEFLRDAFPKENHIPASHYQAKKNWVGISIYPCLH